MPHPWFSSETLKESHLGECQWRVLVTLLFRGPEWESSQPFLIEKGEIKVNEVHRGDTLPLPCRDLCF